MNCIIVDDEETARLIIEKLASKNALVNIKEKFTNAIQAIKYLNQNQVDLIFLDIHMPEFNGFDFIRTLKSPPKIILTTSDRNFAIEAFEYKCIIDYLVKPVTQERFNKAIDKAQSISIPNHHLKNPENDLFVNIDRRLTKIDIPSIYLIEAKGDYISIKTAKKNYIVHSTLKKIEKKLPADTFLRIHRSYIINVKSIIDIEDNSVLIEKDIVPVSRNKRPELLKYLNLL
ncbi:LytR/AlgR family response regulator transcription factor [Mesonia oceanica]|uniref:Transcriptional regulatory protein YpdB n=1 Tax=Mesonia oceanica TaxID=2687242 RepID=A0AC61Y4Z2_9FLAO|nr:LytTR family DNA-binding domain-containing protein [Mesonia oceanica]MAQ39679.1 DNA-binding response regulator [Mesonia sp.]VVU99560.1 Transcriptional regulatory protein YpdB [Mesonia oceanica]|tara:strand:- start:20065 stop:20754 length:690 start_codon:yes stop_codon:yes gene_type:complete